jgi:hypothetical protein
MLPVGFASTFPARERSQTDALDRAATEIGHDKIEKLNRVHEEEKDER